MSMKVIRICKHFCVNAFYSGGKENNFGSFCSYLVLEHVSGGELFDYLVKKGRLSEREVRPSILAPFRLDAFL